MLEKSTEIIWIMWNMQLQRCDYKENSISKIKEHTDKKHGISTNNTLQHVKMDRNSPSEVSHKTYFVDEI